MDSNAFQLRLATLPVLDDILRDGARKALQAAIEREVEEYVERNKEHLDQGRRRLVVPRAGTGGVRPGTFNRAAGRSRSISRG